MISQYFDPLGKALVLELDEGQIQWLDQSDLALKKGYVGALTLDVKHHGSGALFVAPDIATGTVLGTRIKRHRRQEFLQCLRAINQGTDRLLDLLTIIIAFLEHHNADPEPFVVTAPAAGPLGQVVMRSRR